jgi:periplasmic divalent cation tolerance protein
MSKYIQIISTVPNKFEAHKIAGYLINKKLAACVQIIGPIKSVFFWKSKTQNAKEFLLFIKTKANFYERVEKAIIKLHSYEVPEILSLSILKGNKKYLDWVEKSIN